MGSMEDRNPEKVIYSLLFALAIDLTSMIRSHNMVEHKGRTEHCPLRPKIIRELEVLRELDPRAYSSAELERLRTACGHISERAAKSLPGSRKRPYYPTWQGELSDKHTAVLKAIAHIGLGTSDLLCHLLDISAPTFTRWKQQLHDMGLIEEHLGSHPILLERWVKIYRLSPLGVSCCRDMGIDNVRYLDVDVSQGGHLHRLAVNLIACKLEGLELNGTCYGREADGHRLLTDYEWQDEIIPDLTGLWQGNHTCFEVELENDLSVLETKLRAYMTSDADQVFLVPIRERDFLRYIKACKSFASETRFDFYDGHTITVLVNYLQDLLAGNRMTQIVVIGEESRR